MKEWLTFIVEYAVLIIQAMALVIIIIGTIEAFLRSLCAVFSPSAGGRPFRDAYLRYARCLVGRADVPACRGHPRNFHRADLG